MHKLLVEKNHGVLRQICEEVPSHEITGPKVKKLLRDMKKALHTEDDGVAIAAPQIGVALRVFIVSGMMFDMTKRKIAHDHEKIDKTLKKKIKENDLVFINPKIKKESKESALMIEGCLSLRWLYGSVKRKKKVTIEAYNEKGKKFTRGASGLLSQIFQHEIDHLDGILFTDKAKEVENIPPELQQAHKEKHVSR